MRVVLLALAAVACRTPAPAAPRAAAGIEAWIPKDVLLVIGGNPSRIDAVARALGLQPPGELLGPNGLAWMMLADHSIVRCAISDAPDGVNAGVVVKGGISCEVRAKVESIRDKDAAILANLRDSERAVFAKPAAPLWAWGHGQVIGSGIDAAAMQALGDHTLALGVSVEGSTVTITGVPGAGAVAIGDHVEDPPPEAAAVPTDDNPDVPFSAEYDAARTAIDALDPIAAWHAAWGTAKVGSGSLVWTMPVAADQLRAHAQAAYDQVASARAQAIDALVKLRAHDVAAWDKAHE